MSDPQKLLVHEERMMGTPCRLRGHSALDINGRRVETVVYECGPREGSKHPMVHERWAVFIDGEPASSSIITLRNT